MSLLEEILVDSRRINRLGAIGIGCGAQLLQMRPFL